MQIKRIMGFAGIALDAPVKAKVWGRRFDYGYLIVFIVLAWRGYYNYYVAYDDTYTILSNWFVWSYFVTETVVLAHLVEDKKRYLLGNWANWIIIIIGCPLFFAHSAYVSAIRFIKPFLVIRISKRVFESSIKLLAKRHWGSTMAVLLGLVLVSAFILSAIEPTFINIGDGLWFAWQTVTTVGYGDLTPHTMIGRLFTSFIILIGLILISMMIASFSSLIIDRDDQKKELGDLQSSLNEIKQQLNRLENKMDKNG
jgi:voltage-gated potassium channel